ncbi:hypothetical protein MMC28_000315 [Mycoblastus sanguinarius]|nr:hypothetical protein [Mycoblastus sanguinarius]
MLKQVYNIIVEDNVKSGVRPPNDASSLNGLPVSTDRVRHSQNGSQRPLSMPGTPVLSSKKTDELFISSPPAVTSSQARLAPPFRSQSHLQQTPPPLKERPVVHPKPEALQIHSKPSDETSRASSSGDVLAERFSQFRVQRRTAPSGLSMEARDIPQNTFLEMPSPAEYTPSSSEDSTGSGELPSSDKPSGPRDMPLPPKLPPPPTKIPLIARPEVQLPRAPSPAYDPSKTIAAPMKTNMPTLNRKRSVVGTDPGSPQSVKRFSGNSSLTYEYPRSSRSSIDSSGTPNGKTGSPNMPRPTSISAHELYERLRASNVLIIDVRSREEFDQGHIFAKSIMCIEPLGLKSGISAEELEDRLVISPEVEQSLFERRNEFDLVVYYDQTTQSDRFLKGAPTRTEADALRALHDTIYEFNDYKPLRKPPVMLTGGLDAWIDLVGPQAVSTSQTAALVGSTKARTPLRKGRPLGRVPMASANSSLEVRKRRLRDQKPLDAEEEKTWLEKAHNEEVEPAAYQNSQSDGDTDSNPEEPPSPFVHTYEDFLRRFPEAPPVQQSMMVSLPGPPPRPNYPPPPPRSLPSVPSRPPPAVPRPSYSGVSERESTQFSPVSRQPSVTQYPLYTSRSILNRLKLPRTGLINFSVTCYMNATIQCLVATPPLSEFFLGNNWRHLTQKNWKGSNGIMPGIYANLIRSLFSDDVQAVRPASLRSFCARLNREWGVDRQQDAKEFFDFLVDCLHEDLNKNWERHPLRPLTESQEMERERRPIDQVSKTEWDRYTHRELSYISSLFAGQHASRLRCTTCHNTSTTYEAFYSISVEIPRYQGKRPWDIHDCLRSYCKEERLSGDEVWKCPYCKCEREATKQITITRAPQYLVVHFKRFEMRKGESARKVHTPIHFPLFGFDLEEFMVPRAAKGKRHSQQPEEPIDPATTPPYLYDAYAVMRHLGSSGNGGHYISLVKDSGRNIWRKFDDERSTDFEPNKLKPDQRLQNEQAYLVFYGRAAAR